MWHTLSLIGQIGYHVMYQSRAVLSCGEVVKFYPVGRWLGF